MCARVHVEKLYWARLWRISFLSFRLKPPAESEIPKEEKDKYQEEFQNFQQELDKKKEEFQKEHPDVQGEPSELKCINWTFPAKTFSKYAL